MIVDHEFKCYYCGYKFVGRFYGHINCDVWACGKCYDDNDGIPEKEDSAYE